MNKSRKIFIAVTGVILLVSVMIASSIGTSMWGMELHDLEQQIAEIESESRKLTDEIIQSNSLTDIYENQEELGYHQASDVLYLNHDTSVAQAR